VEKIVDRPVEVVRTVERRVEVPAAFTASQREAIESAKNKEDALRREVGWGPTSVVPVIDKKIKVFVSSQADRNAVSIESIRARVESILRRNGFHIVAETDNSQAPGTYLLVSLGCSNPMDNDQISGRISVEVKQYALVFGGGIQKQAWVTMCDYGRLIHYPSAYFHQIPGLFDDLAVLACNDMLKADVLPYSK
jgi:hypothetical protein